MVHLLYALALTSHVHATMDNGNWTWGDSDYTDVAVHQQLTSSTNPFSMPATVNFEGEFPYVREVTGSVAFSAPWTTPFDVLIANNSEENVIVFDFDVQVPGDYTAILFADFGKWTGYETWNTDGISELHYPWETKFFDGPETRNRRWDTFTEFVVELDY